MTTIQRVQIDRQAHDACELLAQAQYQLLVIRGRQLAESDRERDLHAEGERNIEMAHEAMADAVALVCNANGIGTHGSPEEQVVRLGKMLDAYAKQHHDEQQEIGALKSQLAALEARINQPREPAPVGEVPYDANEAAEVFLSSCRGLIVGETELDKDMIRAWLANFIMRGYDEHSRKYGKLIELAIMGDRSGSLYTADAEQALAEEADKFVDPGAPPKGWMHPSSRAT